MKSRHASWTDRPAPRTVLVALGLGSLALGYRLISSEETPQIVPAVTEVRLKSERTGILPVGELSLPRVQYEIEVPTQSQSRPLTAKLVGADARSIPLTVFPSGPVGRTLSRIGYADELRKPRLVVSAGGETLLDRPVSPLPLPIRAIPMVVPIDPHLRLQRTTASELGMPPNRMPFNPALFRLISDPDLPADSNVAVTRLEWSVPFARAIRTPAAGWIVSFADPEVGSLAEVSLSWMRVHEESRVVEVSIELFEVGGQPGLRVEVPVKVALSDGTVVEFPRQERQPAPGNRPRLLRNLSLRVLTTPGPSTGFASLRPETNPGIADSSHAPFGYNPMGDGQARTFVEPLMPLENLGLRQIHIGTEVYHADVEPRGPIRYGRHRLRFRVRRTSPSTWVERRFVRVEDRSRQPIPARNGS
jgi:hypothetical protein